MCFLFSIVYKSVKLCERKTTIVSVERWSVAVELVFVSVGEPFVSDESMLVLQN